MGDASFSDQLMWVLPCGYLGMVSWGFWIVRRILAATARPLRNDFRTTTSVVVPSFREDPDVLIRYLKTWVREGSSRVIIVLDVDEAASMPAGSGRTYT